MKDCLGSFFSNLDQSNNHLALYSIQIIFHHLQSLLNAKKVIFFFLLNKFQFKLIDFFLKNIFLKKKTELTKQKISALCEITLNCILFVNIQILDEVLEICKSVVEETECYLDIQLSLVKYVRDSLLSNFDYSRKQKCLNWYMNLLHDKNIAAKL